MNGGDNIRPTIVAICGKSASGKDTFLKNYLKQNSSANKILLATSRPIREGEVEGKDYTFCKRSKIKKSAEKYLWPIEYNDWTYAIVKDSIKEEKENIGVFNLYWIKKLLSSESTDYNIILVNLYADDKERLFRSLNREENPDCKEICRRFLADEDEWNDVDFQILLNNFKEKYPRNYYLINTTSVKNS